MTWAAGRRRRAARARRRADRCRSRRPAGAESSDVDGDRCEPQVPAEIAGVDLAGGLPADLTTFRYPGSLTTSPYSGGVSWLVLRQPVPVATSTIQRFRGLFPAGDARDPQPLGGRHVLLRPQ